MTRTAAPSDRNRLAAREILPAYVGRWIAAHVEAFGAASAIAGASGEASPALALDAIVAVRNAQAAVQAAEHAVLGVLVLSGVARSTLARATGRRPEALAARLLNTPARWVGAELVRDESALGGWRPV